MKISLEEFRKDLDKYMKVARIEDIYITDEEKQETWILASAKGNWWSGNVLPLFDTIQWRIRMPTVSRG